MSFGMRVTLDSNVWQGIVEPSLTRKTPLYDAFQAVHESLCAERIQCFVCETVGTLEAVKRDERKAYFTSIKPVVQVGINAQSGSQVGLGIKLGTNHDQHRGLFDALRERLELGFALGIRLMRAPRIGIPLPDLFLDLSLFAEELDVPTSAERDSCWGDVVGAIEQRGVGPALLRSRDTRGRFAEMETDEFADGVAEWADGDSIAAHVAYGNDIFCTEDQGKSKGHKSILDEENRKWLAATYKVKFATIRELAAEVRSAT
jgi:hypothetical protein